MNRTKGQKGKKIKRVLIDKSKLNLPIIRLLASTTNATIFKSAGKRTSPKQYELLVDFMEKHGDLQSTLQMSNRSDKIQNWIELSNILNEDESGKPNTIEKWKKVWSDFKNNTKRKAARILQASADKCLTTPLTTLEERVLNIIADSQTNNCISLPLGDNSGDNQEYSPLLILEDEKYAESSSLPLPIEFLSTSPAASRSGSHASTEPSLEAWDQTTSTQDEKDPINESEESKPSPKSAESPPLCPAQNTQHPTARQRRRLPHRHFRKRPRRNLEPDLQQVLINSDREWRNFFTEREQERVRLREIELQQQARWQDLFQQLIVTVGKAVDAFVSK